MRPPTRAVGVAMRANAERDNLNAIMDVENSEQSREDDEERENGGRDGR